MSAGGKKAVFSVAGAIAVSKLLGFVKQMYLSSAFGATVETDMINLAQTVSGDLEYVLSHVLTLSFIPVFLGGGESGGSARFARNTLRAFLGITLGAVPLLLCASYPLARLLAPSYDAGMSARLARYLRIYTPLLIFFVISTVCRALLAANKRFVASEARGVLQSVIVIAAAAVLGGRLGADALVVGFAVAAALTAVWFLLLARRYLCAAREPLPDAAHRPFDCFRDPQVRRMLSMSGPLLIGYSAYYVDQQINKGLASGLGEGAVTELSYGAVLSGLVTAFIASFASIMFSYVTSAISRGDDRRAARIANLTATGLVALFLPVSVICFACAGDIVRIAFGRGAFGDKSVASSASVLAGYSFSFLPLIVGEIYGRVQYGYGDTRRPMINSAVSVVVNIALSLTLAGRFGVGGIAFAHSLASLISGLLNLASSRRHNRDLSLSPALPLLPYLAVGGAACFGAVRSCAERFSELGALARFSLSAAPGLGAYCAAVTVGVLSLNVRRGRAGTPARKLRGSDF